jgi:peptidoglycan-associated lipoprotein
MVNTELAIDEFKKYKQVAPSDAKADQEIRACELALEWMKNPEAYKVEELKDLNSKEEDFSPAYAVMILVLFISHHRRDGATGNKTHGATGQGYTDIFESRIDKKSKWSTPVPVEVINSDFEEGTPSLSSDYKELFFTRCEAGKREKKGLHNNVFSKDQGINGASLKIWEYFLILLFVPIRQSHLTV